MSSKRRHEDYEDVLDSGAHARARDAEDRMVDAQSSSGGLGAFPAYRELEEADKAAIRSAVKSGETGHLTGTQLHYVNVFRERNKSKSYRKLVSPRRGNYRRKGAYKKPYARRTAARRKYGAAPRLSTISRYTAGPIKMAGSVSTQVEGFHDFPIATQAFLQAVGSPFTEIREMPGQINPRRPDPDFSGASVAIVNQGRSQAYATYPYSTPASGSAGMLLFKLAWPFGLGGLDVAGNQTASGTGTANFPATLSIADQNTYVIAEMLPRLTAGQQNYNLFHNQMVDMVKWRVTAAGFKIHDVGQVLTRQGELLGHEVNYCKFYEYVMQNIQQQAADVQQAFWMFGLRGLLDYNTSLGGGIGFTTAAATVVSFIRAARESATVNASTGEEMTPAMGITQRLREPRTEVDFCTFSPLVFIYDPAVTITAGSKYTQAQYVSLMASKGYPEAAAMLVNMVAPIGGEAPASIYAVRSGNYVWYQWQSTNRGYLLTKDLFPLPFVESRIAEITGNQGNNMLCFEALQVAKDAAAIGRPFNVYTASWMELQVSGLSQMYQNDAPIDHSYNQVVKLASHFPVTVKGHSFFRDLWDGVKKAARWIGKNEASIIKGVQAGVRVAKTVAG